MRAIVTVDCLQPVGVTTNDDSNLSIHDLSPPVTIILLSVKLKEMFNIKTKFDTFQILGKEEFSKRTNTRSWEGCEHAKILTKSISPDYLCCSFLYVKSIEGRY